jgi:hypothetical protein
MIPSGTVITYQAKGRTGFFQGESDLVQEMNTEFSQSNIVMRDYHSAWTSVSASVDAYLGGPSDFQFTATLQTNADFNSAQDVASIADHAIYQVTGTLPSSTVPSITLPGSSSSASTGQPAQSTPSATSSLFDFSGITSSLQSGVNGFALLMVGVILAVVLIIAGKSRSIL